MTKYILCSSGSDSSHTRPSRKLFTPLEKNSSSVPPVLGSRPTDSKEERGLKFLSTLPIQMKALLPARFLRRMKYLISFFFAGCHCYSADT
jgi:hypothetical protein